MTTTTAVHGAAVASTERPTTWRAAALFGHALILSGAGLFTVAIILAGAEPDGLAMTVPVLVIGAAVAAAVWAFGRWAQVLSAVFGVALLVLLAPVIPGASIDSFFDFTSIVADVAGALLLIVAAVAELTRRPAPSVAVRAGMRSAAYASVGVLVVLGAVSAVLTYAGQDTLTAAEREGSTPVAMKDMKFAPKAVQATEGQEVRFAVKNDDPVIHDLEIDGVADRVVVKPGSEKLMVFTAPTAGAYEMVCTLHPNMKGTLEVVAAR